MVNEIFPVDLPRCNSGDAGIELAGFEKPSETERMSEAPFHAHVYYSPGERARAEVLRERLSEQSEILFVGAMTDRGVGPHPIPQFEIHFRERSRAEIVAVIEASGLRALVHPLTDDDLADHTSLAHWIGEPLELDTQVLDPPGMNQGVARFGKSDF